MKKFIVITCPKCGREYLPEEIFVAKGFFGSPSAIIRDRWGHINFFEGETLDTKEEYTCDKCGCTFDVDAKISFETKVNVKHTFDEEYSTPIYETEIKLEEPVDTKVGLW